MTQTADKAKNAPRIIKSVLVFLAFMIFSVFASDSVSREILDGLIFAVNVILPTVFPFMVLSDFAARCLEFEKSKFLSSAFEKVFKINGIGISAFLSGIVGGFPIGAKNALELYGNGKISKCECERLMSFSNLPSPAYVISAIGIGIASSFRIGIILYATIIASALVAGFLIGRNKTFSRNTAVNIEQSYDFVSSLKTSASSSVSVVFFISFFSGVCGLLKTLPISSLLKCFLISLTEVGNATLYISDLCIFPSKLSLAFIAFSLSFSGISVILQSLAINKNGKISVRKCLFYKLIQGTVSFIIILLLPI